MFSDSILTVTIFFPLLGALVLLFISSGREESVKLIGLITSGLTFVISLALYAGFDANVSGFQFSQKTIWIEGLSISYFVGIDGMSLLLILLTTFLTPLALLATWNSVRSRLKEYIIKGFVMDDERLKEARNDYFDELLARIRDIRSSEKVFWRKVLEIYATSIDYDSREESSQEFFKTIQNKMHFATHGKTAAEIVYERVDGGKTHMGMRSFNGAKPTKSEAGIAKNYLSEKELDILKNTIDSLIVHMEKVKKSKEKQKSDS